MFKIAFIVTMITHLIACGWYMVAWIGFDEVQPSSWVFRHGIQDETVQTKYLTSLYWAFSTLATVGYGDISAKTNIERMFSIVCMLFGVSWYAFVVSTISSILGMFDRRNAEVKRKQTLLTQFMRDTNVPTELRRRILKYFDFVVSMQDHDGAQGEMESVLALLSAQLRTEVTLHVHRNLIPQIPFFNDKTKQFQAACVARLTPLRFFPGDYISSRGQHADEMYFLVQGRAVVVLPDGARFRSVVQGSYFGEIGCILSEVHRFSIVAATECEVYALSKNDLKELMAEYPDVAAEIRRTARLRIEHLNTHRGSTVPGGDGMTMATSLPGVAYENVTAEDIRTIDGIAETGSEDDDDDEQDMDDRYSSFNQLDETALSDARGAPATAWAAQPGQAELAPTQGQEHGGQEQSGYGQPQAHSGGNAQLGGGPGSAAHGLGEAGASRADIGRLLAENRELRSTMDAMRASLHDIQKLLHTVHAVTLTRVDPLASTRDLMQIIDASAASSSSSLAAAAPGSTRRATVVRPRLGEPESK
jgi:CRP-like cAMP-binding protein